MNFFVVLLSFDVLFISKTLSSSSYTERIENVNNISKWEKIKSTK